MTRASLFAAAKSTLGIDKDNELATALGVGRSFLCLVKNGSKNMPDAMKDKVEAILHITRKQLEAICDDALPAVPVVQRQAEQQPAVLPDQASGGNAEEPPPAGVCSDEVAGRDGDGQRDDPAGERGAEAPEGVEGAQPTVAADAEGRPADAAGTDASTKRVRLKRGTRAAVVLKVDGVYYPANSNSDHTHRRVISLLRRKDEKTVVMYSIGSDSNRICTRDVFVRWLDPARLPGSAA